MKSGWPVKRLGDVVTRLTNGYVGPTRNIYFESGTPYLLARHVRDNILRFDGKTFISDAFNLKNKKSTLRAGDVLLVQSGHIGHSAVVTREHEGHNCHAMIVISPAQDAVDSHFLSCFFNSPAMQQKFEEIRSGSTVPHLTCGAVKEIKIPVPPLPEQQRIVGILDEAFEAIATAKANAEKNLQNARALFESHLQSVFTQRGPSWVEKPLSELCDIKHGYAFEGEFFRNEGEYVLLTPGNFYEIGGYRDRGEKQKYYIGDIPRDYVLAEGDLLVAMTEQAAGLLGSPILVPESEKFLHNQRLGLITPKPGRPWTNEFFFHVFNTQPVRKAIHASASGVKVRHTSPTKIGEVVVAFPTSLTEQKRIVSELASLDAETQRLAAIYQRKLAALDDLKKSLLHHAFTGQL